MASVVPLLRANEMSPSGWVETGKRISDRRTLRCLIWASGPTEGVKREGKAKMTQSNLEVFLASSQRALCRELPGHRGLESCSAFLKQRAGEEVGRWARGITVLTARLGVHKTLIVASQSLILYPAQASLLPLISQ